jgi:hypothetical protein
MDEQENPNMPYITTVRGRLAKADPAAAQAQHDAIVAQLEPKSRPLGATGHMVFANPSDPRDFFAVDAWSSPEGLQAFMSDPATQAELMSMFEGAPDVTVWASRDGWRTF